MNFWAPPGYELRRESPRGVHVGDLLLIDEEWRRITDLRTLQGDNKGALLDGKRGIWRLTTHVDVLRPISPLART